MAGILIFAMLLMYAAGWVLVSIRVRLDTYANLLEASISGGAPKHEASELKPSARNGTSPQDTHGRLQRVPSEA